MLKTQKEEKMWRLKQLEMNKKELQTTLNHLKQMIRKKEEKY